MPHFILVHPGMWGLAGLLVGTWWTQHQPGRPANPFEDAVLIGPVAGGLVGVVATAACKRWRGVVPAANLIAPVVLLATLAAPVGWLLGDGLTVRSPRAGLAGGVVVGGAAGFILGAALLLRDRPLPPVRDKGDQSPPVGADTVAVLGAVLTVICAATTPQTIGRHPMVVGHGQELWLTLSLGLAGAFGGWAVASRHGPAAVPIARGCALASAAAAGVSYVFVYHWRWLLEL